MQKMDDAKTFALKKYKITKEILLIVYFLWGVSLTLPKRGDFPSQLYYTPINSLAFSKAVAEGFSPPIIWAIAVTLSS